MAGLPTYENDLDIRPLLYMEITEESLLEFFFKKGGKVNINNLQWCIATYGNGKVVAPFILQLEIKGLIKQDRGFMYRVTTKAKWERLRDDKTLLWIFLVVGVIAALLALL